MDYEKAYKEALERARTSRLQLLDIGEEATEIEYIFPELKESETGKSKFKAGNWITFYGGQPYKILKIEAEQNGVLDYLLLSQNGHVSYYNKEYVDIYARLWTIQDAKDGDTLASNGNIILFKGISNSVRKDCKYIQSHCLVFAHSTDFYIGCSHNLDNRFYPSTKEQCKQLFDAMHKAGYAWNAEKKELKKIEQKYVWSKEDEKFFETALWHISNSISNGERTDINCDTIDWLKSLKDRIFSQSKQGEQNPIELYDRPEIDIKDDASITSRLGYIPEELKPIADFIIGYAHWNLHKAEWNHPVAEVPLFRVLDALISKGKGYQECNDLLIDKKIE